MIQTYKINGGTREGFTLAQVAEFAGRRELSGNTFTGQYTTGTCSDCGGLCSAQILTADFGRREMHARCGECHGKAMRIRSETTSPDWFASEERQGR